MTTEEPSEEQHESPPLGGLRAGPAPSGPLRVFINYRREDSAGHAGRLYDSLSEELGEENVFIDVETMEPGVEFPEAINDALESCHVLVALIGRYWLTAKDEQGRRRIDSADDFVRLELETAFRQKIRVIPVLVDGAEMPEPEELPEGLVPLSRRQALEISQGRWRYDVGRLVTLLRNLEESFAARLGRQGTTPTPTADAPSPAGPHPGRPHNRARPLKITAGGVAAGLLLVLLGMRLTGEDTTRPTTMNKMTPKEVFEAARGGTVELYGKIGEADVRGSGVIFDAAKGLVLTNSYVVAGTAALKVRLSEQRDGTPARVVATAPCEDLAVVQMTTVPPGAKAIPFGSSAFVQHHDEVIAVGYTASSADSAGQTVSSTSGTVQSPDIAAEPDPSLPRYASAIQHSAMIGPGASGGPLLNDRAELIGINTARRVGTRQEPAEGPYYAISVDHIKRLLPDLVAGRSQADPGWSIAPFSQVPLADVFEATGYGTRAEGVQADRLLAENAIDGVFVFGANPDSPADKANIDGGDLIERINGVPVTTVKAICDILQSASPGQTLSLEGRYLTSGRRDQTLGDPWVTKLTL